MGKLFDHATKQSELYQAWRRIRENGIASHAEETRIAVEMFEKQVNRNIRRIQKRLKEGEFEFEPQTGILKEKSSGGHRGIVMASVHNRVVERAWLDALQAKSPLVRSVITYPTSVGGVPDRSVPHGLKLIKEAMDSGKKYFVRSDISGFFDSIARKSVIARIAGDVGDEKFIGVLGAATTVTLANEATLGEDRSVFPTDTQGVAQGSPLSPLFGNILLYDFDRQFNDRGVVCIRFIDDFLLLADEQRQAHKAFESAKKFLANLGLKCHDPFDKNANAEKAQYGTVDQGFVFLGYDIRPGLFQPSDKARQKLEKTIDGRIYAGKKAIAEIKTEDVGGENTLRYAQTLVSIDRIVRGWGNAFAYGNATSTIEQLDERIDTKLNNFRNWYADQIRNQDWKMRRRTGGVCLLADIKAKTLDDVPFRLDPSGRFVQSARTLTISTDGSVVTHGRRKGKDRGTGGWAFVVHETGQEASGSRLDVTNNQMELTAVIEAIRQSPPENSLRIRTDSQYVAGIVNQGNLVKSNTELWREYRALSAKRKIRVEWVKGHAGDQYNERADVLANQQAQLAHQSRGASLKSQIAA
jgi:ribonuclease HI/retron-type reverse transcriptase